MMTDPISDMLTRIRNASATRAANVSMPMSKMKFAIAKLLEHEGYIHGVTTTTEGNRATLTLGLRYDESGVPAFQSVKRLSKPGRRVYAKADDLRPVRSGTGIAILSTPNGIMTNREARKRRLGGELICEIY